MEVRAIIFRPPLFSEELYQRSLTLVDSESHARIKRFYRREDACRTLIGRLLIRTLLKERGVAVDAMTFAVTETKKPYITTPGLDPPIAYNISHDNGLIAMAFAAGDYNPPAFSIGIDIMKVQMPRNNSLQSFVESVGDQLTPLERRGLLSGYSHIETLRRFFWIWTMKEAYTKALGIGLGFDFRRVEYDIDNDILLVDNQIPPGWHFSKFTLTDEDDEYEGVVAQFVGGLRTEITVDTVSRHWLKIEHANEFVEKAIADLQRFSKSEPYST